MTDKQKEESSIIGSIMIIFPSLILLLQQNIYQYFGFKRKPSAQINIKTDEVQVIKKPQPNQEKKKSKGSSRQNSTFLSQNSNQSQNQIIADSSINEINENPPQEQDLHESQQQKIIPEIVEAPVPNKKQKKKKNKRTTQSDIHTIQKEFSVEFDDHANKINQTSEKLGQDTSDISSILQDGSFLFENQNNASVQESIVDLQCKNVDLEGKNFVKKEQTSNAAKNLFINDFYSKKRYNRSYYEKSQFYKKEKEYQPPKRNFSNRFYSEQKNVFYKEKRAVSIKSDSQNNQELILQDNNVKSGIEYQAKIIDELPNDTGNLPEDLFSQNIILGLEQKDSSLIQVDEQIIPLQKQDNPPEIEDEINKSKNEENIEEFKQIAETFDLNLEEDVKIQDQQNLNEELKQEDEKKVEELLVESEQNDKFSLVEESSRNELISETQLKIDLQDPLNIEEEKQQDSDSQKQITEQVVQYEHETGNQIIESNSEISEKKIQQISQSPDKINEKNDTIADDLFFFIVSIFDLF